MVIHIRQIICTAAYTSHTRHRCGTGTQRLRAPKSRRLCRSSRASKIPSNSVPIEITYPGTGNYSAFSYDGLWRNAAIVETTSGSVTSTKQFVWSAGNRREQRDASSSLTAQFFSNGETISSAEYFYSFDHLGSVREMSDNSGSLKAQYTFDPSGRVIKISETVASDYGFSSTYLHSRSGLNLALNRNYDSLIGRWISRDPLDETAILNRYIYANNRPVFLIDPDGLDAVGGAMGGAVGGVLGGIAGAAIGKSPGAAAAGAEEGAEIGTMVGSGMGDVARAGAAAGALYMASKGRNETGQRNEYNCEGRNELQRSRV